MNSATIGKVNDISGFFAKYNELNQAHFKSLFGENLTTSDIETLDFCLSDLYGARFLQSRFNDVFNNQSANECMTRIVIISDRMFFENWLDTKRAIEKALTTDLEKPLASSRNGENATENKVNAFDSETASDSDESSHTYSETKTYSNGKTATQNAESQIDFSRNNDFLEIIINDVLSVACTSVYDDNYVCERTQGGGGGTDPDLENRVEQCETDITNIKKLIPTTATEQNKLATLADVQSGYDDTEIRGEIAEINENINGIYTISDTNWTDEPSGIDLSNLVECVCTRSKGSDGLWSKWSDPVPWSVWGEDGVDGEGVEYIYTVTPKTMIIEGEEWDVLEYYRDCRAKKKIPEFLRIPTKEEYKNWSTDEKDYYSKFLDYGFIPGITDDNIGQLEQEWYDEPQDVDADQPYEWVAIRKKQIGTKDGNPNEYVGEWQDFSIPNLLNKFATDGRSSVMAYAFTRSNDALNTLLKPFEGRDLRPKGGTFNDPTPDPSYYIDGGVEKKIIWYDSIPDGTSSDDVWMTSKFFSSISDSNNDGETVDNYWSIPCKMTDRSDFQVEFASYYENPETEEIDENVWPNPNDFNTYYNEASGPNRLENAERAWRQAESEKGWKWGDENTAKNTVYMATCRLKNQKWTDWHVVKVKGETGKAGTSVSIIGTAYLETEGACDNVGLLNNTQSRILSNGRAAIYVLHYCENTDKGIMYKWLDPEDPENPENVDAAGYYIYSGRYKLHTGDGWLINGELWVWDGDSYENVGQIQGPAGEADHLYIAFSDEDEVLEKNSNINIDLTLKVGKYIGYCAGPKLSNDALIKASTYNWSRWKGQDGWGQEQVFLLTKENPGYDNSYKLTRDSGPAVPSDNTEKHGWRPAVDNTVKEWVSPLHIIKESTEDYTIGDVRWSDIPLTPSEEFPFCWVATRSTSNWKWKGENGFATLYSNYVTSGVDAIYLELSEDSVSVPLDMSGNIDTDNDEQVMFDLTATLYSGRDKIANHEGAELVKYYYRLNEESEYINNNTSGQSPLFQIKKSELENKPSKIYIKVEWKDGFWEKECKINYGTSLYEITVSKSVLHKDLSTGYLFENYDTVDVYVKRWVNGAWLPVGDTFVYSDIKMLDETSETKSIITDSNGNASFTGLSKIKDISNIEFYLLDRHYNQICNETIGIVANGKDGAWQEFIYRLYPEEVDWSELPIEWTSDVHCNWAEGQSAFYWTSS